MVPTFDNQGQRLPCLLSALTWKVPYQVSYYKNIIKQTKQSSMFIVTFHAYYRKCTSVSFTRVWLQNCLCKNSLRCCKVDVSRCALISLKFNDCISLTTVMGNIERSHNATKMCEKTLLIGLAHMNCGMFFTSTGSILRFVASQKHYKHTVHTKV